MIHSRGDTHSSLSLIGLFVAATSYLTHDSRIAQKNAERLADNINTTFRTARSNMVLGKGVMSGSTLTTTTKRVISIGSNGITTVYGTTNTGTESNLPYPFYDNDPNYKITDISVSSGILINGHMPNWDQTGVLAADITILKDGTIDITATSVSSKINAIRITAGYEGFEQSVMLDRIMGRSEVVEGKGESTFIIPPPPPPACTGSTPCGSPGSCYVVSGCDNACDSSSIDDCAGVCGGSAIDYNGFAVLGCGTPPVYSCTGTLVVANATTNYTTGLTANTPWQSTVPTGKCYYTCTGGFTGANCDVPAVVACIIGSASIDACIIQ